MSHMIGAALLAAFLLYIAALYQSAQLALLGLCIAGLTAAGLLLLVYRLWAVEAVLLDALVLADADKPLSVPFFVRARHPMLGRARLLVQMEVRQLPRGRAQRTWVELTVPRRGEERQQRLLQLHYAGGYAYRLRRVRIYDWTGLFFLEKGGRGHGVTHLLPAVHELSLTISAPVRGFFGEAEVYDDLRGGHDASETFQIREYMAGDKLQNIHWKLTAKTQELMVREHSLPKGCPIILLLGGQDGRQQGAQHDRFLQLAASLSFALVDAECPHIVSWHDGGQKLVRTRVDSEEDFYEWQLFYMEGAFGKRDAGGSLEERYRQDYRGEPFLHCLRLDGDLKLYLDGKLVYAFAKKGAVVKEMEALELYL
ncbi:DUF58 domain-containing protein [Lachnospiraceae bacterium 47-T17]